VAVSGSAVYVSGATAGSLDGQANAGLLDGFVAKYSTAGGLAWTRLIGTSLDDRAAGVAAAGSSVYVVGYAEGPLPGASFAGIYDGFLRSYDSSGKVVWTREFGTFADDRASGVSICNGCVDVVGWTRGTLAGAASYGATDVAALRYATNGRFLASAQVGSSANDEGYGIATDSTGTYLVGETAGALATPAAAVGGADAFILKLAFGG